ncbi:hypothetical protein [Conchiformibius steedae]|uniref:hypothetical protein n=1 Tax=Conchiformibius steedae TaxID=153493 RepID=UPI001B808255|nr:hypothetical protein [Conchiformibius steedae]
MKNLVKSVHVSLAVSKLHAVFNRLGELITFRLTAGNADNRPALKQKAPKHTIAVTIWKRVFLLNLISVLAEYCLFPYNQ